MKERAPRNKTISLTSAEIESISKELISITAPTSKEEIINKTINNNLLEVIDLLPENFVDLLIIDPPYNLSKNYNGLKFAAIDSKEYLDYLNMWLPKIIKVLKPNGSLYICCDWKCTAQIYNALEGIMCIKNRITWQREKGRGAKNNWKNGMEDIWFAVKDENNYYFNVEAVKQKKRVLAAYKVDGVPKDWEATDEGNFRLTFPSNFWDDISIPYWSMPENTDHPTQKPEKLIAKLILASCPEGGVVFDPFLGSGTTSVVAKKLGREYCGIEINREFACLAEKRLELSEKSNEIQGYSEGVFWERNSQFAQRKSKRHEEKRAKAINKSE